MLPKEAINEYQTIYKKLYGIDLTFSQAEEMATDFFGFFRVVYKPIKKTWIQKNDKKKI